MCWSLPKIKIYLAKYSHGAEMAQFDPIHSVALQ
jgi:hypothetical protein